MSHLLRFFVLCLAFILTTGCASSLTADIDPTVQLSALKSFHVLRQPQDQRGVEKLIAAELTARGKSATSGDEPANSEALDAVITYVDKWWWDITTYMLELKIEIRDPHTNYVVATGHSYRTSLNRKSPEGMVKEVIGEILASK